MYKKVVPYLIMSTTTVVPFGLLSILLFDRDKAGKSPKNISSFILLFIGMFYILNGIIYSDVQLFLIATTLLVLPLYLYNSNKLDILNGVTFGLSILVSAIFIEQSYNLFVYKESIRSIGLHHNSFNASVVLILTSIAVTYNYNKFNITHSFLVGAAMGFTLTRSLIFFLPFISRNKLFGYLLGIIAGLIFIYTTAPKLFDERIDVNLSTESRIETLTKPNYNIFNGYGLGQSNKVLGQNPHNLYLSSISQLGYIFGILFITIILYLLLYYGYKFGYWKILPILIYSLFDGQLISNFAILSTTLIYLYLMAEKGLEE